MNTGIPRNAMISSTAVNAPTAAMSAVDGVVSNTTASITKVQIVGAGAWIRLLLLPELKDHSCHIKHLPHVLWLLAHS